MSSNHFPSCTLKSPANTIFPYEQCISKALPNCQKGVDHSEKEDDKFHTMAIWAF